MLERVIDDWMTNAGERGFESAFTQLLIAEGYRVLHHPAHHPMEHGKDLVAYAPDGALCAFQLKGGDLDLKKFESIQQQLFALAATALVYPGVDPPRRPDRAALVATGRLTPPSRDRLATLNAGNQANGLPSIECVEREHLVSRFTAAHGRYLPNSPADLRRLLDLYIREGRESLPIRDFAALVEAVVCPTEVRSDLEHKRAISSGALMAAIAAAPWQSAANHLAIAQSYLLVAQAILYTAATHDLADDVWEGSYSLAMQAAREALNALLDEAAAADDLVVPHIVDGVVYPIRALIVTGWLSAGIISEVIEPGPRQELAISIIKRELPYAKLNSEAGSPHLFLAASVLDYAGSRMDAASHVFRLVKELSELNRADSPDAIPTPYHSLESVLRKTMRMSHEFEFSEERFDGHAYTLHVLVDWMARRKLRAALGTLWPAATHITCCEFRPSSPARVLSFNDDDGQVVMWHLGTPARWAEVVESASTTSERDLPAVLWRNAAFLPFLVLLFPYRLTATVAKALDYNFLSRGEVTFDDEVQPPPNDVS